MKKVEPIVKKIILDEDNDRNDLRYWLSRPPEERIEAMRFLREHYFSVMGHTEPPKIEKIVIKRP